MTAVSSLLLQEYDRPNSAFMLFYERIGGSDELSAITAMRPSAAAPTEAPAAMDTIPAGPPPVPFDMAPSVSKRRCNAADQLGCIRPVRLSFFGDFFIIAI